MTKINFFLVSTILLTFIIQTKANPKYTNPQGQTADEHKRKRTSSTSSGSSEPEKGHGKHKSKSTSQPSEEYEKGRSASPDAKASTSGTHRKGSSSSESSHHSRRSSSSSTGSSASFEHHHHHKSKKIEKPVLKISYDSDFKKAGKIDQKLKRDDYENMFIKHLELLKSETESLKSYVRTLPVFLRQSFTELDENTKRSEINVINNVKYAITTRLKNVYDWLENRQEMKKKLEKIEESNGQKKKEGEKADKDEGMKQWFKKKILQQEEAKGEKENDQKEDEQNKKENKESLPSERCQDQIIQLMTCGADLLTLQDMSNEFVQNSQDVLSGKILPEKLTRSVNPTPLFNKMPTKRIPQIKETEITIKEIDLYFFAFNREVEKLQEYYDDITSKEKSDGTEADKLQFYSQKKMALYLISKTAGEYYTQIIPVQEQTYERHFEKLKIQNQAQSLKENSLHDANKLQGLITELQPQKVFKQESEAEPAKKKGKLSKLLGN